MHMQPVWVRGRRPKPVWPWLPGRNQPSADRSVMGKRARPAPDVVMIVPCPDCGKIFDREARLAHHRASRCDPSRREAQAQNGRFPCPDCGLELDRKWRWDEHRQFFCRAAEASRAAEATGFTCLDCGTWFRVRADWAQHRASDKGACLRHASQTEVVRKRPATCQGLNEHRGNVKRTIRYNIAPFILFLKSGSAIFCLLFRSPSHFLGFDCCPGSLSFSISVWGMLPGLPEKSRGKVSAGPSKANLSFFRFAVHTHPAGCTVRQQHLPPGPVFFVPFANPELIPWDLWKMAETVKAEAGSSSASPDADGTVTHNLRLMATGILATFGWTVAWVRCLGFAPLPCTPACLKHLRAALFRTWGMDEPIMNPQILCCNGRSFRGACDAETAQGKIEAIIRDVRDLLDRVEACGPGLLEGSMDDVMAAVAGRGFPADGYSAKLASGLLPRLGLPMPDGTGLALGSGTRAGLSSLTGESPECYRMLPVTRERLEWVRGCVECLWDQTGRAVEKPDISCNSIVTMLCVWSAAGFPEEAVAHDHVMSAVSRERP